ncbi:helix-turn-helix domain-containing protein [Nocardioides sp.]|uniref:helix-turn-helix domain-containing protein n=1 Tax=Nocardioides sp. TaxID=35761 RepID=UPI0019B74A5E|nr:helix-turn-helix transcriptional regulator [Nocardioides sp.]
MSTAEQTSPELADATGVDVTTANRHLAILEESGFVCADRPPGQRTAGRGRAVAGRGDATIGAVDARTRPGRCAGRLQRCPGSLEGRARRRCFRAVRRHARRSRTLVAIIEQRRPRLIGEPPGQTGLIRWCVILGSNQ